MRVVVPYAIGEESTGAEQTFRLYNRRLHSIDDGEQLRTAGLGILSLLVTSWFTTVHNLRCEQTIREELLAPPGNLISRCRALRNRLQSPRSQMTQDAAEEPTTTTGNSFSSHRALRNRFQHTRSQETQPHTQEPTNSTMSSFYRLDALRNRF
jgi:hypothetical protein